MDTINSIMNKFEKGQYVKCSRCPYTGECLLYKSLSPNDRKALQKIMKNGYGATTLEEKPVKSCITMLSFDGATSLCIQTMYQVLYKVCRSKKEGLKID